MRKAFKNITGQIRQQVNEQLNQGSNQRPLQQNQPIPNPRPDVEQLQQRLQTNGTLLAEATEQDVLSYRYHHGTNIGAIFVAEKWLFGNMFAEGATGSSELDAVKSQVEKYGIENARRNFETFWSTTMTPEDWNFLANTANITTIRLPIGYFTLGPRFCQGTPFEAYSAVYQNSWLYVRQYITTAASYGIGTLIDFHALPGGANSDIHSGTSSGKAELWNNPKHLGHAIECMKFIVDDTKDLSFVVGLQLVNEAVYQAQGMYQFYDAVINALYPIKYNLPLYISDAWDVSAALQYSINKNIRWLNPIVVDTHKYYCFSDEDKSQNPHQIIGKVNLNEIVAVNGQGAGCVVGEYSCVMDGQTWGSIQGQERTNLATAFGRKQSECWQTSCGGCYFWTYKMAWMPGGEWGFREQTSKGALPPPPLSTDSKSAVEAAIQRALRSREDLKRASYTQHVNYWIHSSPGQYFEHKRFEQGWDVGYSDALVFFGYRVNHISSGVRRAGADRIGLVDIWLKKREKEYEAFEERDYQEHRVQGTGVDKSFFWEFSHGLQQGIRDFERVVGFL